MVHRSRGRVLLPGARASRATEGRRLAEARGAALKRRPSLRADGILIREIVLGRTAMNWSRSPA